MQKNAINKSLGLRYPQKKTVHPDFLNIDAIYEYKAINPSASYKAQSWVFLNSPAGTIKKGKEVSVVSFTPETFTIVGEHDKHEQAQFISILHGRKKYYVLLDGKTELIPSGKSGMYKLSDTVNVYVIQEAVILSQPFTRTAVGYKVFGYKQNMRTDTGQGIEYTQPYIATQVDYQTVYFPANDFEILGNEN